MISLKMLFFTIGMAFCDFSLVGTLAKGARATIRPNGWDSGKCYNCLMSKGEVTVSASFLADTKTHGYRGDLRIQPIVVISNKKEGKTGFFMSLNIWGV